MFYGDVRNRYRINNAVVVSIMPTSPIKRIQRRAYYRLKIILPVTVKVLDGDTENESQILKGYSIDISGGGLKLNMDYCLALEYS